MIEPKREIRKREDRMKLYRAVKRYGRLEILSMIVGAISGLAAVSLDFAIEVFRDFLEYLESMYTLGSLDIGLILAPTLGGLVSGIITWKIAPEVRGHGIPSVLEAFLHKQGIIRPRVPIARILSSGALIGLGGSAGREGPVGQVGAGLGSFLAQVFKLPIRPRRILLISGLSAGIAAAFDAPLGGVLFGVEVLTGSVHPVELIPAFLASISAVSVSWTLRGAKPIISIPSLPLPNPVELAPLLGLGVVIALVSRIWVDALYGAEDRFRDVELPEWLKPSLGGLGTGLIAYWSLGWGIMGPGFDGLNRILSGQGWLEFLVMLALLKLLATSLSIGSGGSGGIFTPTLFIGAAVGAAYGQVLHAISPSLFPHPELFAVAGMAAHFTAAARAPLTAVVLVTELARSYALIPALISSCATSYFLSLFLLRSTMYTRELEEKGERVVQVGMETLDRVRVEDVMVRNVVTVTSDKSLEEVHELMLHTHHMGFPVVDAQGNLKGMVTFEDLMRVHRRLWPKVKVEGVMRGKILSVRPDDTVHTAVEKMLRCGVGRLPVIEDGKLVGLITKTDVLKAYGKAVSMKDLDEAASI
ncbi:MAG: chloride channel protein [Candidatus Korarchaeota archaeon]|nr:chloride channel protein [Candidatus Korarchaeota archaeon]